jgi:predicted membrane channel-forming protein YqfA (hemolysin III family)
MRSLFIVTLLTLSLTSQAGTFFSQIGSGQAGTPYKALTFGASASPLSSFPYLTLGATVAATFKSNFFTTEISFTPELFAGFELYTQVGFYGYARQGIAAMTNTPSRLSSTIQLPTTIGAGLHSGSATYGIFWKHYSNGTTSRANRGQNYLGIELGYKF